MKFIGSVLIVLTFLATFTITFAARHSTSEEISYALNQSVNSLYKTDDYDSVLNNSDYRFFQSKKQICYVEFNYLSAIRGNVGGQEAATCLANAYLITMLRKQFFDNMESCVEAIVAKNESDRKYYESRYIECYKQAEKWREEFRRNYGY